MVDFQVKIAGAAGDGAMAVGLLFAKALNRAGFKVFNYNEYPSLIRGGHNTSIVRASENQVGSLLSKIEVLIALNGESYDLHENELIEGGILIWDERDHRQRACRANLHCLHIPLRDLSAKIGNPIVINTIALGALSASLNLPLTFIDQALKSEFASKGKEIIQLNQNAAKLGFDFINKNYIGKPIADLSKFKLSEKSDDVVISGNEACALGAIAADCQYFSGYPMTPSTGLFQALASYGPMAGLTFVQADDEISAINSVIGASYAGVRAMTATAGGGFALMTEAVGLAAMTEVPLVVVEVARPGPATGLPTWTEQGDLRQVLHAGQGDFPRILLSPGDPLESMQLTHLAFQLAYDHQLPVFVLTDKYLAESFTSSRWLTADEIKNSENKNGRLIPGQTSQPFITNSDEHDPQGFSSEEAENRAQMMKKRFDKLDRLHDELPSLVVHGVKKPEIALFGFGSTKWPIIEAVNILIQQGIKAQAVHLPIVWPLPKVELCHYFEQAKKSIIVENNFSGQLEGLIRQETGIVFDEQIRKYNGRPFLAEEIVEQVKSQISKVKSKVSLRDDL